MNKAPTVRVSAMSNLLDSLTVTLGANLPPKVLRSEVMSVVREALKIHNKVESERDILREQLRVAREGLGEIKLTDIYARAGREEKALKECGNIARETLAAIDAVGEGK